MKLEQLMIIPDLLRLLISRIYNWPPANATCGNCVRCVYGECYARPPVYVGGQRINSIGSYDFEKTRPLFSYPTVEKDSPGCRYWKKSELTSDDSGKQVHL